MKQKKKATLRPRRENDYNKKRAAISGLLDSESTDVVDLDTARDIFWADLFDFCGFFEPIYSPTMPKHIFMGNKQTGQETMARPESATAFADGKRQVLLHLLKYCAMPRSRVVRMQKSLEEDPYE